MHAARLAILSVAETTPCWCICYLIPLEIPVHPVRDWVDCGMKHLNIKPCSRCIGCNRLLLKSSRLSEVKHSSGPERREVSVPRFDGRRRGGPVQCRALLVARSGSGLWRMDSEDESDIRWVVALGSARHHRSLVRGRGGPDLAQERPTSVLPYRGVVVWRTVPAWVPAPPADRDTSRPPRG